MPKRGKCALCHLPRLLLHSHLIGRAMYKLSREKGLNPVVMTPRLATHTQHQVKEYLFCEGCEDLFNKRGEAYMGTMICNGKSFPLLDRMKLAPFAGKAMDREGLEVCFGWRLGVDTEKLAYYAISLLWRAAVYKWRTLEGQTTTVELDEERQEQLRCYLVGRRGLPDDVGVVVTVCTDAESQGWVFLPTKAVGGDFKTYGITMYAMLVRGIFFNVITDAPGRFPLHTVCCVHSEEKFLWVRNCIEETKHSFKSLNAMARVAENLKKRS